MCITNQINTILGRMGLKRKNIKPCNYDESLGVMCQSIPDT